MNDAIISDCGTYRYSLTRTVLGSESAERMTVIMCNPSTADWTKDDPTIRKLYGFARQLDIGHITVVNVYAYRATDPKALKRNNYDAGLHNGQHLNEALLGCKLVVCAWGRAPRPDDALYVLRKARIFAEPRAFRLLKDGTPEHPLYIPYGLPLVEVPL